MFKNQSTQKQNLIIFMVIMALVSLGMAFSDSIFGNYFKEVYGISAYQRGILEFPRELPGMICLLVIAVGSFLGDIRLAMIAQVLSFIGILALGLMTPTFAVMTIYLFINSLGMHTLMPLRDSIGISLIQNRAETGKWLGKFGGIYTAFQLVGGLAVFIGFASGWFTFQTKIKWVFVISAFFFFAALLMFSVLNKRIGPKVQSHKKIKLVFDKTYRLYYLLAVLHGVQKQIIIVFGPWVLIEILSRGAETITALNMIGGFVCMLTIPVIGRWVDRFGIRRMLFFDAYSFIGVYALYGVITLLIVNGTLPIADLALILVGGVFVLDKVSFSLDLIRVSYLRAIAKKDSDIAHTLSTGISLDHLVTIVCAYLGGIVWTTLGPQYVFFITAIVSFGNVFIAMRVKNIPAPHQSNAEKNDLIDDF